MLIIEGRPGSGKTTLVHKVTRDWAKGITLKGTKMVFLITLRLVGYLGRDENLSDILKLFYGDNEVRMKVERELVKYEGRGACFILDGLDEYQVEKKKDRVIYQLLNKECLSSSMVLVASRPVATSELKKKYAKRVEVIGFFQRSNLCLYRCISFPYRSSEHGFLILKRF